MKSLNFSLIISSEKIRNSQPHLPTQVSGVKKILIKVVKGEAPQLLYAVTQMVPASEVTLLPVGHRYSNFLKILMQSCSI
jgi:hypothetical protein